MIILTFSLETNIQLHVVSWDYPTPTFLTWNMSSELIFQSSFCHLDLYEKVKESIIKLEMEE